MLGFASRTQTAFLDIKLSRRAGALCTTRDPSDANIWINRTRAYAYVAVNVYL